MCNKERVDPSAFQDTAAAIVGMICGDVEDLEVTHLEKHGERCNFGRLAFRGTLEQALEGALLQRRVAAAARCCSGALQERRIARAAHCKGSALQERRVARCCSSTNFSIAALNLLGATLTLFSSAVRSSRSYTNLPTATLNLLGATLTFCS